MKMRKAILCPVLALALSASAFAMEVPSDTVIQNLNGSQRVVKVYTLPPESDPEELIEEPFIMEGYRYSFADITKEENLVEDSTIHKEVVTVETKSKDLSAIMEQLEPTMDYEDGTYSGTLTLDHTSLHTEVSGYSSGTTSVKTTKTIGPLDRNDMSYVPATTKKDGNTLTLSNVEWQVIGTDLVGETLVPASYQAVATYTGTASYSVANGYITTAEYVGTISRKDVDSITYRVTYLGTEDNGEEQRAGGSFITNFSFRSAIPFILGGVGLIVVAILLRALVRSREEVARLREKHETDEPDFDEREGNEE